MFEPASGEEIGAVLALMREYYAADGYDFDAGRAAAALAALVADPALGRLWVAREAGVVVAYLAVTFGFSLEYGGRDAFLDELVVAPAHRGRGLGRRALAVAEAACRQAGVRALHLDLEPGKPGAARLYRAAGFLPLPRRRLTKRLA